MNLNSFLAHNLPVLNTIGLLYALFGHGRTQGTLKAILSVLPVIAQAQAASNDTVSNKP